MEQFSYVAPDGTVAMVMAPNRIQAVVQIAMQTNNFRLLELADYVELEPFYSADAKFPSRAEMAALLPAYASLAPARAPAPAPTDTAAAATDTTPPSSDVPPPTSPGAPAPTAGAGAGAGAGAAMDTANADAATQRATHTASVPAKSPASPPPPPTSETPASATPEVPRSSDKAVAAATAAAAASTHAHGDAAGSEGEEQKSLPDGHDDRSDTPPPPLEPVATPPPVQSFTDMIRECVATNQVDFVPTGKIALFFQSGLPPEELATAPEAMLQYAMLFDSSKATGSMFESGAPVTSACVELSVRIIQRALACGAFTPWTQDLAQCFEHVAPYLHSFLPFCNTAQRQYVFESFAPFAKSLEIVRWKSTAAKWVHQLCLLLQDEEIIVLHVAERQGFVIRISDVVNNSILHVLLNDLLARTEDATDTVDGPASTRRLPGGTRPSAEATRVLTTKIEQQVAGDFVSTWDMMSWMTLSSDGRVPSTNDLPQDEYTRYRLKIWLEGAPADIPALNGKRIVMLSNPSYHVKYSVTRPFNSVVASARVTKIMSHEEFVEALDEVEIAVNAPRGSSRRAGADGAAAPPTTEAAATEVAVAAESGASPAPTTVTAATEETTDSTAAQDDAAPSATAATEGGASVPPTASRNGDGTAPAPSEPPAPQDDAAPTAADASTTQ